MMKEDMQQAMDKIMDGVETEEDAMTELAAGVVEWDTCLQIVQTETVVEDREHLAHIVENSLMEMRCVGNCQKMQC